MGLEKTIMGFLVAISLLVGFMLMIENVHDEYDVVNETGYVGEINAEVNSSMTDMNVLVSGMYERFEETTIWTFVGDVSASMLDLIRLFVALPSMVYGLVTLGFSSVTGLNTTVSSLLFLLIMFVIMFAIVRIILGRSERL